MQRFFAIATLLLIVAVSKTQAVKCYSCVDEKSCQNPDTVTCKDDLGCSKLSNTKPSLHAKGCFNPVGSKLLFDGGGKICRIGTYRIS